MMWNPKDKRSPAQILGAWGAPICAVVLSWLHLQCQMTGRATVSLGFAGVWEVSKTAFETDRTRKTRIGSPAEF